MDIVIKRPKTTLAALIASSLVFGCVFAKPDMYGNFPVTEKSYSGKKKDSTSYTGQVARHVLHNSLKKLAGKGNGNPNPELKATMMSYYSSKDAGRKIIDPTSKGEFKVKQTMVDEISKGKNLKGKTYKGLVNGFPGQMSGPEVFEFLIDKASSSNKGFDPVTGYNYPQLISKFMMGAVFYSQAVDNYLDEKMGADNKPNNKPYKKGAHYTGKEHSWDEAFGYFGAPAHAMALNAKQAYGIAKRKDVKVADANGDGVVDLKTEMTFAHAYYAADSDKAGTKYMHTIVDAFIKGRQLIRDADGAALTDQQRAKLMSYTELSGHFGDNRRSARPRTTAHSRRHEYHVRSVQGVGDAVTIFESRCSPHLGVGAGTQTFRNTCTQLQHRFRTDVRKGLRVGIGANKIHAVDLMIDHVANGVTATTTDTDHLDHGTLWCTVY